MTIKEMLIERLVATAMELGSANRHRTELASEAEKLRKEVARLNHEKAEQAKAHKHLVDRYEGELDAAENMLVRMEEERDDLAFRLEESNGE